MNREEQNPKEQISEITRYLSVAPNHYLVFQENGYYRYGICHIVKIKSIKNQIVN